MPDDVNIGLGLSTERLSKSFGAIRAVVDVSVQIPAGQVTAVIGPNGSGKSTLLGLLAGKLRSQHGRIHYGSTDITRYSEHRRVAAGVVRTLQEGPCFPGLTVRECVDAVQPSWRRESLIDVDRVHEFSGLGRFSDLVAGKLAYGQKKLLNVILALHTAPRVLLLDEPAAGLSVAEIGPLREMILDARSAGVAVGLVDHNMSFVMQLADAVTVLDAGEVIFRGSPADAQADRDVVAAYFGGGVRK